MVVGPFIIANFATILRRKLKREKLDLEEKQLVIVLSLATVSPQSVIHCAMIPAAI